MPKDCATSREISEYKRQNKIMLFNKSLLPLIVCNKKSSEDMLGYIVLVVPKLRIARTAISTIIIDVIDHQEQGRKYAF